MSQHLSLALLGPPQIQLAETSLLPTTTRKSQALLIYLAMNPGFHTREALCGLLWPEMPDKRARNNLRTVLHELRILRESHLQVERQAVAFRPQSSYELDVKTMLAWLTTSRSDLDPSQVSMILQIYRGEFLEGFYIRDAAPFEEWVTSQREYLHRRFVDALMTLSDKALAQGAHQVGLHITGRLLAIEPLLETAHLRQMRLLAQIGRRSEALAQYDLCQQLLAEEFGIEPSPEFAALRETILTGRKALIHKGLEVIVEAPPVHSQPDATSMAIEPLAQTTHEFHPIEPVDSVSPRMVHVPTVAQFFGREEELALLRTWLVDQQARIVAILGMGGVGKTALATTFVHSLTERDFEVVIWRSLINAPPLVEIMETWLQVLAGSNSVALPTGLEQQFDLLIEYLRQRRCLLILDNVESLLQSSVHAGHFGSHFAGYTQLLTRIGQHPHQSALLLTSRELPHPLTHLMRTTSNVHALALPGLPLSVGAKLLMEHGLNASSAIHQLVERYAGNPLALILVTSLIDDIYGGEIQDFLGAKSIVFDDIRYVLDQQFDRLSVLEQQVLYWLAIEREPVTLATLGVDLFLATQPALRDAVSALRRRYLIERHPAGFTLQNVMMEYLTERLIGALVHEVGDGHLHPAPAMPAARDFIRTAHFNLFLMFKAQSKEYVRQSQVRMVLQPVVDRLMAIWGKAATIERLTQLLATLRMTATHLPGYAATNLFHMLAYLQVDFHGYDFSGLTLWQADLRRVNLPAVNLSGCDLSDASFLEPIGNIYALAFTPDGKILAAGTGSGALKIWRVADRKLLNESHCYTSPIRYIQFGEDGKTITTAAHHEAVKLWSMSLDDETLKPVDIQLPVTGDRAVAMSLDATVLATSLNTTEIQLWDTQSGELIGRRIGHQRAVITLQFSPDGRLLASASADHTIRIWSTASMRNAEYEKWLIAMEGHTNYVQAIAFSPDGRWLASGSDDWQVRIWEVATGRCLRILTGHVTSIYSLAFSPDGRLLASGTHGGNIRLWDVLTGEPLNVLRHHQSLIWSLAFSPDGRILASGGSDQSVCLWDPHTRQLMQTLEGQPQTVNALAVHPSGRWLASGGADQQVHLWDLAEPQRSQPRQSLIGHTGWVRTLAFQPQGRLLASAGNDRMIHLWDTQTLSDAPQPVRTLHGHESPIEQVVFHPNGTLLASCGFDKSILLWDVETGGLLHRLNGHERLVWSVAFSLDGRYLFSSSSDETVCAWDLATLNAQENSAPSRRSAKLGEEVVKLLCPPHGAILIVNAANSIYLLDHNLQIVRTFKRPQEIWMWDMALSTDGSFLVTTNVDPGLCIWEISTSRLRQTLSGHREEPEAVAISPDDSTIYSGSTDGEIKIWDAETGKCLQTLHVAAPYSNTNITGVIGITEAQKAALTTLGAIEDSE